MNTPVPAGKTGELAVAEALRVQQEASLLGFDWPDISGVLEKIREEVDELQEALAAGSLADARDELGDLLFSVLNASRFLHADPLACLENTTSRFQARFDLVRKMAAEEGCFLKSCSMESLDDYWARAKKLMKQ